MFRHKTAALLVALALTPVPQAMAETLLVEGLQQGRNSTDARPSRGMSMEKVTANWGQPAARNAAVGDPPIARWEYEDFVVYFEYSRVIHSVQKR